MKKFIIFVLICTMFTGCKAHTAQPIENDYSKQQSRICEESSDRFTITINPTRIIMEEGNRNIIYSLSIINKSEMAYKNFFATVILDDKLDQYIAAGVYPLPFSKINIAAVNNSNLAKDEAKGVEINFQQLLSESTFMEEAGLDYKDILELGKDFCLLLQWDGGEEKHNLTTNIIDESIQ